jgi:hypothetical protein
MLATRYPTLDSGVRQVEARMARALRLGLRFPYAGARELLGQTAARWPARVLLVAAGCAGSVTEVGLSLAAAAEFVQTALHAHSGVEESPEVEAVSVRSRWHGPRQAVMLGDYLMAVAFKALPEEGRDKWAAALAAVVRDLAGAHLLEARGGDRKGLCLAAGGSLLAFCGRAGVVASDGSEELARRLEAVGRQLGGAHYLTGNGAGLRSSEAERRFARGLLLSAQREAVGLPEEEGKRWLCHEIEAGLAAPDLRPVIAPAVV